MTLKTKLELEKISTILDLITGIDLFRDKHVIESFKNDKKKDLLKVICEDTRFARKASSILRKCIEREYES